MPINNDIRFKIGMRLDKVSKLEANIHEELFNFKNFQY